MKIAVFALCVVLPSLCVCTPLPDYSVAANSDAGASIQSTGNGNNVSATSNSNSNVNIGGPPAVPPTVSVPSSTPTDTTSPPCSGTPPASTGPSTTVDANSESNVNINQQGGGGGSTTVDANSESNANINQQGGGGGSTTVDANSESNANINQQGGGGGSTTVDANSDSNVNINQQGGGGGSTTVDANSDSNVNINQQRGGGGSTTVDANSQSNASIDQQGSPPPCGGNTAVDANSQSNASVDQQGSPSPNGGSTTVDANSQSNASVNQQGSGSGGSVNANASSSASVTVTASGNKCGKPDCDGFNKYVVLVKNQGDIQKFTSGNWMVWKSSSSSAKIETQEAVCAPRYLDQQCKASQYKITVQSETDIFYEVWGTNGKKVFYMKQKLNITSEQYHIYNTKVVSVAQASSDSQEVVAIQNEQSITQYFDNNEFAILDSDYQTYMICTTKGQNSVTFISVSQEVYASVELKQQVSQKVDQVLKVNNLSSTSFIEVTNKFDIDITKYNWDQCGNGGSNNGNGNSVDVNANSSSSVDVKNGSPSGGGTDVKAGADSSANVDVKNSGNDVKADANSNANASVNSQGSGNNGSGGKSGGDKPTQQGFTNYSVLKISNDEFKSKIDKTTWHVAKYSETTEQVQSDVTVCADRYVCSSCKAVKFQYTTDKKGCFVMKEWGYDGTNLIYIQENISFSTQDFVILKAEVKNVMKATKDTDVAVSVDNKEQVKSYLSSEYAVLGTDYKNFFIGQTSCDKGSITFVAFIEEIHDSEEKQQSFAQKISEILKNSGIDESKLKKLTHKFDVDTNKYNKVKSKAEVSDDGKTTSTKQETEHKDGQGKTTTETTVTNGPSPSGGSGGSTDVNVSTSSDSSVNVNNNNSNNSPPPCSSSPATPPAPPPASPPAQPPASPPTGSVDINASSNSNASVDSTGSGNTSVDASSNSQANVQVNNGTP